MNYFILGGLAVCLLLGCLLALSQRHSRGEDRHYRSLQGMEEALKETREP